MVGRKNNTGVTGRPNRGCAGLPVTRFGRPVGIGTDGNLSTRPVITDNIQYEYHTSSMIPRVPTA